MSDSRINNNAPKTILRSLSRLKDSRGDLLSLEALNLYSHLYSTYGVFGKSFAVTQEEIGSAIHFKRTKCHQVVTELLGFNLIRKACNTGTNGIRKTPNVLNVSLMPPPPFIFFQAQIRATDFSGNSIPVKNVFTINEDSEELILKYNLIYLGSNHSYEELLKGLYLGDILYFVAEPMQLEDGRWDLGNVFNLTTEVAGAR